MKIARLHNDGRLVIKGEVVEYPLELKGGRNLLSTSFEKYDSGLYSYIELVEENTEMILKLYDRDSSIDMSGIYFGFTGVGYSAEGNVMWSMANGDLQRDEIIQSGYRYFSFYPGNEVNFNKIFDRFYIKIEKGNKATPWTPSPEDLGLVYSEDIQSFTTGFRNNGDFFVHEELVEGTKVSINSGTFEVAEIVEGAGDILVHRYVHQGNKVIQPTGLNKETGLFTTTEPIALSPGTKRQVITAFNYQADGSIPREWNGVEGHYIDVVSSTSFYIRSGSANGEILTYTNTNNNLVDVNSFRFEYDFQGNYQVDLSEYNIKKGRFRFQGTRHRPGWSYIYMGVNHIGGNHQHNYGTFVDGRDYLSLDVKGLFSIEDNFVSAKIDNYIKTEWNNSNGTWVNFQGSNTGVLNQSFDNPSFGILSFSYAMANGSVVEVYDIEHSLE